VNGAAEPVFGDLLRRLRDAAGLTQEELAERSGLTSVDISLLERGERRKPQSYTVQKLAEALQLSPADRAQFEAAARRGGRARSPFAAGRPSAEKTLPDNLPIELTSLIGREQELARVKQLLSTTRLLTLTGAGGSGKTRLAVEAARGMAGSLAHGTCFVALAPVEDAGLVLATVAQALALPESDDRSLLESLVGYLRDRQGLLLLDNFEHLLSAAPFVPELLGACPALKVLATSREPLRVRGEREYPVPPLPVPDPGSLPPIEALSGYGAVALFLERARAVEPDFALTSDNAADVVDICAHLDGLPLAIELVATRVKVLPPRDITARLVDGGGSGGRPLQLVAGGRRDLPERQRTLRDTIRWSYDLLAPAEQKLFARLSVFAGGCTLEGVEAVCDADGDLRLDVLEGIALLVEKSLVRREGSVEDEPRYTLPEMFRAYGLECLAASGEAEALRRAHRDHFLALGLAAGPKLKSGEQLAWLRRIEREYGNLRAALAGLLASGEGASALRLAIALSHYWLVRGYMTEGREWLRRALAAPDPPSLERARALFCVGYLALRQSDTAAVRARAEELLAIGQEGRDERAMAYGRLLLGCMAQVLGDYAPSFSQLEEAVATMRRSGERWELALFLYHLGLLSTILGEDARVRSQMEEAKALWLSLGDRWGHALSCVGLGTACINLGDLGAARATFAEGLSSIRDIGGRSFILPSLLLGQSLVTWLEANYERAAPLLEESAARFDEIGNPLGNAPQVYNAARGRERRGELRKAAMYFVAALTYAEAAGAAQLVADILEGLGAVAAAAGQMELAAKVLGACERQMEVAGATHSVAARDEYERCVAEVRAGLGDEAFERARAEGRAMTFAEARALARGIPVPE
jgi:predicted ATPase/DNA-binding XRE family transcriptional regulator